eukprot:jgi/Chrzof1/15210/Cz09g31220.t1
MQGLCGTQAVDQTVLLQLLGVSYKKIKRSQVQDIDTYVRATSLEGQSAIKQYWESHCTTLSKLPSITLLDQGSYPRGLSDSDFVRLLIKLTDLEPWQIWDLRALLDTNSCGFVGCPEFTLLIVLLSTSTLEQRLQAVYTFKTILYSVFAGCHVPDYGLAIRYCALLLDIPLHNLWSAEQQLNLHHCKHLSKQEFELLLYTALQNEAAQLKAHTEWNNGDAGDGLGAAPGCCRIS